jgi:hypothetical protein
MVLDILLLSVILYRDACLRNRICNPTNLAIKSIMEWGSCPMILSLIQNLLLVLVPAWLLLERGPERTRKRILLN